MNGPEKGKRVEVRRLKPGQSVPCDGRIYVDEEGLCFGIRHPLRLKKHYLRLLAEVRKHDQRLRHEKR